MTRQRNANDRDPLHEYLVTVAVERHTMVRARSEEDAKERVQKQKASLYGSDSNIQITHVQPL